MSKARLNRDRRVAYPPLSRVTRRWSGQGRQSNSPAAQDSAAGLQRAVSPASQQGEPPDTALTQGHSLMSMREQEAMLSRKGSESEAGLRPHRTALGKKSTRGALHSIARLLTLGRCHNVLVVAGAGISTASGIPDFRTPGTGLYANLQRYDIPFPEAIFNIDFFSSNPRPFFSLAKELYPGRHRPSYVHYFIRMLHQKGLLLRMYTQNIDGLERMCGIPEEKLVEAHGNFSSASCHLCYTPFPAQKAKEAIMNDEIPTCSFCQGTVKPDIVFFGEDLPHSYFQHSKDFPKADLLIVMGTSLQIQPFASLVDTVKSTVPRLLLNREAVGSFRREPLRRRDYVVLGDLLDTVTRLAHTLGWHQDICDLIEDHEYRAHTGSLVSGQGIAVALVKCPRGGADGLSSDEDGNDLESNRKSTESPAPSN